MNVEVSEKTRSEIGGDKILLGFLELDQVFYMVRIVWWWAITFMLQVFVFKHKCRRYEFEHRACVFLFLEVRDEVSWAGPGLFLFFTPPCLLSAPLGPFDLFLYIFLFLLHFWLYLFSLNIKNHQKYFLNFYIFILLFLLFFGHRNSLIIIYTLFFLNKLQNNIKILTYFYFIILYI